MTTTRALRRLAIEALAGKTLVQAGLAAPPPRFRPVADPVVELTADGWLASGRDAEDDGLVR
ncbi:MULTISPECIES: hypothetical protein [unclassified Egicoccus]|uniref:hypothetical protein n=1 Tax=unclassified Egicoccus TaxID=2635606 RepID=UPI00359DA414